MSRKKAVPDFSVKGRLKATRGKLGRRAHRAIAMHQTLERFFRQKVFSAMDALLQVRFNAKRLFHVQFTVEVSVDQFHDRGTVVH